MREITTRGRAAHQDKSLEGELQDVSEGSSSASHRQTGKRANFPRHRGAGEPLISAAADWDRQLVPEIFCLFIIFYFCAWSRCHWSVRTPRVPVLLPVCAPKRPITADSWFPAVTGSEAMKEGWSQSPLWFLSHGV